MDSPSSRVALPSAWKSVLVEEIRAKHYRNLEVPADNRFELAFSVYNQGSVNTGKLTISLVAEKEDALENLSGDLGTSGIRVGYEKEGSFTVVAKGNSGDVINANIVVTDEDGHSWSTPVTLTVK